MIIWYSTEIINIQVGVETIIIIINLGKMVDSAVDAWDKYKILSTPKLHPGDRPYDFRDAHDTIRVYGVEKVWDATNDKWGPLNK